MSETATKLWVLSLFMLFLKILTADMYSAYFKCLQARDARRAKGLDSSTDESIVRFFEEHALFVAAIAAFLAGVFALLLKSDLHGPFLTLMGLTSSLILSGIGALGDLHRAEAMRMGTS